MNQKKEWPRNLYERIEKWCEIKLPAINEPDLEYVISTLPENERNALVMRLRDGLVYREIGENLGMLQTYARHLEYMAVRHLCLPSRLYVLLYGREGAQKALSERVDLTIEDLEFSVRTYNNLKRGGYEKLSDLIPFNEEKLLKIRNLGQKSLMEIKAKLENDVTPGVLPDITEEINLKKKMAWPENLYRNLFGKEYLSLSLLPESWESDVEYVLSTLTHNEREAILLYYKENLTLRKIDEKFPEGGVAKNGKGVITGQSYFNHGLRTLGKGKNALILRYGKDKAEKMLKEHPIDILASDLNMRTMMLLRSAGYKTLNELVPLDKDKVMSIKGFGQDCMKHLLSVLDGYGMLEELPEEEKRQIRWKEYFESLPLHQQKFIVNLGRLMKENSLTQKRLSLRSKIAKTRISGFLNGKCSPELNELVRLSEYFGVTIDSMIN